MNIKPPFIATGVGSMPYTDIAEAIGAIKEAFPQMPHWPQLPRLTSDEGLINQHIAALVKIGLLDANPGSTPFFDATRAEWVDRVTEFYSLYLQILEGEPALLDNFALPKEAAEGFYAFIDELARGGFPEAKYVKGQITGPVTLGLQLNDQDRKAAYYDAQMRDIIEKTVALQACWQVKSLSKYGVPVIIFIDEPALHVYGQSTYITMKKEEITGELNAVIEPIHNMGAYAGIHVCAGTEWSMILESDVDILNFDAFDYFTSLSLYSDGLNHFIQRGGILAWGLVPTSEIVLSLTANDLTNTFEQYLEVLVKKGLAMENLLGQVLITPSCGTGSMAVEAGKKVYRLTREVSAHLQAKYCR